MYPPDDPYEDDFYSPDRPAVDDPLSIFDKSPDFDTSSNNFMQEYDISINGVSFKALIYLFREVLGKNDDRLSGDIAVGHPYAVNDGKSTPTTFSIHLRLDHGH